MIAGSACTRPPGAEKNCAQMTEPTTFSRGLSIALMALLDAVMPPLVAVGLLYGLCAFYDIQFKGFFVVLSILVAMLSLLLPRVQPGGAPQLLKSTLPLAM